MPLAPVADIPHAMSAHGLPTAFSFLAQERNAAVDTALVEALTELKGPAQGAALRLLMERNHQPSLTTIVARFARYEPALQELVLGCAAPLSPVVPPALALDSAEDRAGAIEFLRKSNSSHLAYLLVSALRAACPLTRDRAGGALHSLAAAQLRERHQARQASVESIAQQLDQLGSALRDAVVGWELHFQPKIIEAALWLADRTSETIFEVVQKQRGQLAPLINGLIRSSSDPRMAGFVIRALGVPALQEAAVAAICKAHEAAWTRALVAQAGLLANAAIAQGCLRIRDCPWLHHSVDDFLVAARGQADKAIRLLSASGGVTAKKAAMLRAVLNSGHDEITRATVEYLLGDESETATDLLALVAARHNDDLSESASTELRRRHTKRAADFSPRGVAEPSESACPKDRGTIPARQDRQQDLQTKLRSTDCSDRLEALRAIREQKLQRGFEEQVHRLAHDPDSRVRSLAVSLLSDLPGPTTERILRTAINDPDDRVQANAVEALDRLNVADRAAGTAPKLNSEHGRVRANAVKSLLRLELRHAAVELLNMLADARSDHRRSALWVVQRLQLRSVLSRVRQLGREDPDERIRHRARGILRDLAESWTELGSEPMNTLTTDWKPTPLRGTTR